MLLKAIRWILALGVAQVLAADGGWELTLLKPRDCGACSLLEQTIKRQGNIKQVSLSDGAGGEVSAEITRRTSSDLTALEWEQLLALPYFDARLWERHSAEHAAQVLLKHDGRIVAAGNIADSTDLREAQFPAELTLPLGRASVAAVREAYAGYFQQLYLNRWNLDYFFRLAKTPALASDRKIESWIARQPPLPQAATTPAPVLLAATASGAVDNPIFNAIRSEEIRSLLVSELGVDPGRFQVFHGGGKQPGFNAVEQKADQLFFVHREIPGAEPFALRNLARFFEQIRARPGSRNLLVFIGHGGPDGALLWGEVGALSPADLLALHNRGGGDDILVSGNCYGGVMAEAMSCGFFGARPDTIATGCQSNAAEVAQSKDYLHVFFESLAMQKRAQVDTNGDGVISFEEAHWYATLHGDERNITYSTVDALADDFFRDHAVALPEALSLGELQQLAERATAGERAALASLAVGLDRTQRIPLRDLAAQATQWSVKPEGPRPMLGQLARRLLYTQRHGRDNPALVQAQACGSRSVAAFLAR